MGRIHRATVDPVTGQNIVWVDGDPTADGLKFPQGTLVLRRDGGAGTTAYLQEGPLASDLHAIDGSGGGGGGGATSANTYPEKPPAVPNAKDDEYGESLDGRWSVLHDVGSGNSYDIVRESVLRLAVPSGNKLYLEQSAPGSDFLVTTKLASNQRIGGSIQGLFVRGSNGYRVAVGPYHTGGVDYMAVERMASDGGWDFELGKTAMTLACELWTWAQLEVASGTVTFRGGYNGIRWTDLYSASVGTLLTASTGIGVMCFPQADTQVFFDLFRVE